MPEDVIRRLHNLGVRAPLGDHELAFVTREPTEAGEGAVPGDIDPDFARARREQVRPGTLRVFHRPDWASELAHKGVSVEEMLQQLRRRVLADPHEQTLVEATMIVNDIARLPAGPALLERYVTADLAAKLIPAGEEDR